MQSKPTKIEKIIFEMLTENTGAHPCDSGGAYGRHFERNQRKTLDDFRNEPAEAYARENGWIERRVSVFHYLLNFGLELDALCLKFNRLNKGAKDWDAEDVYGVSGKAWKVLTNGSEVKIGRTFNTYNGDSDLSQILQGTHLEIDGESYILLQIHGGCDARGGYTDARLFKQDENAWIENYLSEYKTQEEIEEEINEGYLIID